jgi:hypothetical protein
VEDEVYLVQATENVNRSSDLDEDFSSSPAEQVADAPALDNGRDPSPSMAIDKLARSVGVRRAQPRGLFGGLADRGAEVDPGADIGRVSRALFAIPSTYRVDRQNVTRLLRRWPPFRSDHEGIGWQMVLRWFQASRSADGGLTTSDELQAALKADWENALTGKDDPLTISHLLVRLRDYHPQAERVANLAGLTDSLFQELPQAELPAATASPTAAAFGIEVMLKGRSWTVDQVAELLARMNNDHAVVTLGSSVQYLYRTTDASGQASMRFLSDADMNALYAPIRIDVSGRKSIAAFSLWKQWPRRRQYDNVGLFPPPLETPHGYLNLWTGFALKPKEGDWTLMREHIRQCICGGNEEHFDWVMDWLAHLVQRPGEKMGTALVLKSEVKGTGKTVLNTMLKRIFGVHAIGVSKSEQFVGRFNGHLKQIVVLGIEEGFWAGDKQAEGALKNLITEPRITIEQKRVDAFEIDNYTRLIFTSNNDWVVPAAVDERRFMVLEVVNERAKDPDYFGPLFRQMFEQDGLEAMLFELSIRDFSRSDLRNPPETDALKKQRALSLTGLKRWLLIVARDGEIVDAAGGPPIRLDDANGSTVRCRTVIDAAKKAINQHEGRDVDTGLGELLSAAGVPRVRKGTGDRQWVYSFPPLPEFQANVERVLRVPVRPAATEPPGELIGTNGARPALRASDPSAAIRAWDRRDRVQSARTRLKALAARLEQAKPAMGGGL